MKLKMMGLAVCLLGAASAANAGYTWSNLHLKNYLKAPTESTRGCMRGNLHDKSDSKAPTVSVHGYTWRD
jgi:hypothetical protein